METKQVSVPEQAPRGPAAKFRAGAVCATIWRNEKEKDGKSFAFHSISLERGYKDKGGEWQNTGSLRINDLPRASLVLSEAYKYLVMNGLKDTTEEIVV